MNSEVYRENNKSTHLYFFRSGKCGFVLSARFKQFKFIDFDKGCQFGITDIVGSLLSKLDESELDHGLNNWN